MAKPQSDQDRRDLLIPEEQANVALYGHIIPAVRLSDGRIAAVFSALCEALGLTRPSQIRRIQADEVLGDQLVLARIETQGGPQALDVLTAWAIPSWLQGVQLSRIAPEKRPAILAFKREAADALYKHFSRPPAQLATPANLVPTEPVTKPERPAEGADPLTRAQYHRDMAAWLEWQADIEQWRGGIESRLESVEEVTRLVPEILERLGPQTISPEHQRTIQSLAKRLHEARHIAYSTTYAELGEYFHVARYTDIPESRWQEVMAWFQARLR